MLPRANHVAAAFTALLLSACATPDPSPAALSGQTEAPNPIQVSLLRDGHAINFPRSSSTPDRTEVIALNSFLSSNEASRGDTILIERTPPSAAKGETLEARRTAALTAALSRQGLRTTVSYSPALAPGEMSLTIERYIASAPNCPNWSKAPGNDFANTMHSDFGCATAANLAAMIDDPRDLVVGRPMGAMVGDPATAPVHAYRTGKVASLSGSGSGTDANSTTAPATGATQQ